MRFGCSSGLHAISIRRFQLEHKPPTRQEIGGHAEAVSIDEAAERADVLVIALWLDAFEQLIAQYGGRLAGKVIVDPSNAIGPDGSGGFRKVIGFRQIPLLLSSMANVVSKKPIAKQVAVA